MLTFHTNFIIPSRNLPGPGMGSRLPSLRIHAFHRLLLCWGEKYLLAEADAVFLGSVSIKHWSSRFWCYWRVWDETSRDVKRNFSVGVRVAGLNWGVSIGATGGSSSMAWCDLECSKVQNLATHECVLNTNSSNYCTCNYSTCNYCIGIYISIYSISITSMVVIVILILIIQIQIPEEQSQTSAYLSMKQQKLDQALDKAALSSAGASLGESKAGFCLSEKKSLETRTWQVCVHACMLCPPHSILTWWWHVYHVLTDSLGYLAISMMIWVPNIGVLLVVGVGNQRCPNGARVCLAPTCQLQSSKLKAPLIDLHINEHNSQRHPCCFSKTSWQ